MQKNIRVYVSFLMMTILLSSPFILSKSLSVKACPPPPPETLISLYFKSDLIAIADFTGQTDGEISTDEETYQIVNVTKNLEITKVLKGNAADSFAYSTREYRDKNTLQDSPEDDAEVYQYIPYGYQNYTEMTVGNRYLFFFVKDSESGDYDLADETTGFRNLDNHDLNIFEKRLAELKTIVETEENQLSAITDWYLKCIEEPATRWDGVMSLSSSFEALEYEDKDERAEREKFLIDEDFSEYAPQIAENLSDSQKNFLSGLVFSSLQQSLSGDNDEDLYDNLDSIVKKWDKQRLAIFAFGIFQTTDKSDFKKTTAAMRYIYSVVEDDLIWELIDQYGNLENIEVKSDLETDENRIVGKPDKMSADKIRDEALDNFSNRYYELLAKNFAEDVEESAQK